MEQGFLEMESMRANRRSRKRFIALLIVFLCLFVFLCLMVKSALGVHNETDRGLILTLLACLIIFAGVMLIFVAAGLAGSCRVAVNGKNLILPYEGSRMEIGKTIDREVAEGKVSVDEYMEPKGKRILLTPSYLLLGDGVGKFTVIPREKIYWLCAQEGRKGASSFIVRLMVFTEKQTFYVEGTDVEHAQAVEGKLYHYIPNLFEEYDTFELSYQLDKLFNQNREEFVRFYKNVKWQNEPDRIEKK